MAFNILAILVGTYGFNKINWNLKELKKIVAKICRQHPCNNMDYPKADVDHLYLSRSSGGRGMIQLELPHKVSMMGFYKHLTVIHDWMLQENYKKNYFIT